MTIRKMSAADASAVALLGEQLGYPVSTAVVVERLTLFSQRSDHGCFVAEAHGIILGWVEVFGVQMLISPLFFAEIGGLVVNVRFRRQGIGRALISQAEVWAAAHHYTEIRLRSGLQRVEAHAFYQSIGYEGTKTSHMFRKVLPITP